MSERERGRGTTIGALAVADTLVRLIKMSELHENRVEEGEGDGERQQITKVANKTAFSRQTIRAMLSMNSCRIRNQLFGTAGPPIGTLDPSSTRWQSNEPQSALRTP